MNWTDDFLVASTLSCHFMEDCSIFDEEMAWSPRLLGARSFQVQDALEPLLERLTRFLKEPVL